MHRHRYHGVLAPHAALRTAVVAIGRPESAPPLCCRRDPVQFLARAARRLLAKLVAPMQYPMEAPVATTVRTTTFAALVALALSACGADDTLTAPQGADSPPVSADLVADPAPETHTISVDVGQYSGQWRIVSQLPLGSGNRSVTLASGSYQLEFGTNIAGSFLDFTVAADGTVTTEKPGAVTGGMGSLTFANVDVIVYPGAYDGRYRLLPTLLFHSGPATLTLVPGVRFTLDLGAAVGGSNVGFDVNPDGTVTSLRPAAAAAHGNELHFQTLDVTIDVGAFPGAIWLGSHPTFVAGTRTLSLVRAITYVIDFGLTLGSSQAYFSVAADGTVTSTYPLVMSGGYARVTLENVQVSVIPSGTPAWGIWRVVSNVTGPGTIVLVPNVAFGLYDANASLRGLFTVSTPCAVVPSELVVTGNHYQLRCGGLNSPPLASVSAPSGAEEGQSVTLDASSSTDPDGDVLSYLWDLGDGATATGPTVTHAYADDGSFTATVTVTDGDGATAAASSIITVGNLAPVVLVVTGPEEAQLLGSDTRIDGVFADPGSADTHAAVVDWGDGATSTATIDGYTLTATHTYGSPGVYTVSVRVTDDDGASGEGEFRYVVVYTVEAGHVTGAGWYRTGTAKTNFGMVVKYRTGSAVPEGNTRLDQAGFSFDAEAFTWMVNTGDLTTFRGVGKANGASGYDFMVSAVDGRRAADGIHRFRIRISQQGTGAIVYDNQPGAPLDARPSMALSGGSIVIHN